MTAGGIAMVVIAGVVVAAAVSWAAIAAAVQASRRRGLGGRPTMGPQRVG